MERTPNKSQHTKFSLEKKILAPPLQGFEPAAFRSRVQRSNQQAITPSLNSTPIEDVPLLERLCLVFTNMPGELPKAIKVSVVVSLALRVTCVGHCSFPFVCDFNINTIMLQQHRELHLFKNQLLHGHFFGTFHPFSLAISWCSD